MQYFKKLKFYFRLLIVTTLLFVLLSILIWISSWTFSTKLVVFSLALVIFALVSLLMKSFLMFYSQKYHIDLMIEDAIPYVESPYDLFDEKYFVRLQKKGFTIGKNVHDVQVMYRYQNDKDHRFYRYGGLEIIMLIRNQKIYPNDQIITDLINQIENELIKKKQFIHKYYLFTFKQVEHMDQSLMPELTQVRFERQQKRQITSIHIYQDYSTQNVYFLHSKTHYPNAYYEHAVHTIYDLIQ